MSTLYDGTMLIHLITPGRAIVWAGLMLGVILLAACSAPSTSPVPPSPPLVPTPTLTPAPIESDDPVAAALPTPRPRRLNKGELELAAERDDIPAIFATDDLFVDVSAGSEEWLDEEPVVGLEIEGVARAYPVRLLSLHEIVNDVVGGQAVAVTWCPLCYTAIVFDREIEGREVTFGVSGYLYRNNLVMYDHQSNTLWSQALAQGLKGAQRGRYLEILPSVLTTWGAWKAEYPQTTILSAARLGRQADEVIDPYAGYYVSGAAGLLGSSAQDARLTPKALVLGVISGKAVRAYAVDSIRTAGIVNDRIAAFPLVLIYDNDFQTAYAYRSEADGRELTFEPASDDGSMKDAETGSLWTIRNGEAIDGPLSGAKLTRINAPLVFWFAWADLHPGTDLYLSPTDD